MPAQNETEYSKEYMNEPYELFSYNENIINLKDANGKFIILGRDLWDDGNWKECVDKKQTDTNTHNLKIGDTVKTTNEHDKCFNNSGITGKIINITTVPYPNNEVATLDNGKILDTDWLEKYDPNKWCVGQEVWDILEGRGVIIGINMGGRYPVLVNMEKDFYMKNEQHPNSYTLGGIYMFGQGRRLYNAKIKTITLNIDKLFPKK